jgi:hypothetical protein
MIKFFKKMVEQQDDVKIITIEYHIDKKTIKSGVQFFHNAMEILAMEATRYLEHMHEKFPAFALHFTSKYRPISVYVVADEHGNPLDKIKELQAKVVTYSKQVNTMAHTEMKLREEILRQKNIISDIMTDGVTKLTRDTGEKSEIEFIVQ